jgi:hypothetical protein
MKNKAILTGLLTLGLWIGGAVAAHAEQPAAGRSTSVPIAPDAPSSYTVQKGDTLWAIASKFLSKPWYWPEIWYLNTDIKNPHLIYPGDTLRLVYDAQGNPHLVLQRGDVVRLSPQMRPSDIRTAIPALPYEVVAAFMSKPSVISKEDAATLPYITGFNDGHVAGGVTDAAYVRGLHEAPVGTRFHAVHLGKALKDPETGDFLGYEGIYTGVVRLDRWSAGTEKNDFSKLTIVESGRETMAGDRIVTPPTELALDFVPHPPAHPVTGKLVAVMDGVNLVGPYEVVVINRGTEAGLEPGNVLEIFAHGDTIKDRGHGGITGSQEFNALTMPSVRLPDERAGTFMVFKAYENLSYGLVLNLHHPAHTGDVVKTP